MLSWFTFNHFNNLWIIFWASVDTHFCHVLEKLLQEFVINYSSVTISPYLTFIAQGNDLRKIQVVTDG